MLHTQKHFKALEKNTDLRGFCFRSLIGSYWRRSTISCLVCFVMSFIPKPPIYYLCSPAISSSSSCPSPAPFPWRLWMPMTRRSSSRRNMSSLRACSTSSSPTDHLLLQQGALHKVRVVLVGPQHGGNVGSVCRAAANFECQDIRLVDPRCDYLGQEGHNAAANTVSRYLMQQLRVEKSLPEAFQDCSMAVAFTRRTGKIRLPSLTLADLKIPGDGNLNLALVFGREDCGLHTHELLQCTHVCTIPSGTWQGSLNLSHAVVAVLSRLYEAYGSNQDHHHASLAESLPLHSVLYKSLPGTATVGELENLLLRWEQIFMVCNQGVGKMEYKTPERLFMFIRKILQRARPSAREVAYLHGFLTVIEILALAVVKGLHGKGPQEDESKG